MANAFNMSGVAGLNTPHKQAASTFDSTYVETVHQSSSFAGLTVTNDHLQTTPTADTSSLVIQPPSTHRVVITGLNASTTQAVVAAPFIGTLAASGSTDDLLVYQASAYNQFNIRCNILLPVGMPLIHYRVQGDSNGDATTDANTITVSYKLVHAV